MSEFTNGLRRSLRDLKGLCVVCGRNKQMVHPKTGKKGKLCGTCALRALSQFMYGDEHKLERDLLGKGRKRGLPSFREAVDRDRGEEADLTSSPRYVVHLQHEGI